MPIDSSARRLIADAVKNTEMSGNVALAVEKYAGNESFRLMECVYEDYSKNNFGYTSSYKKLKITLQRSDASEPETVNFFVKSLLHSCKEQAEFVIKDGVFLQESNFYRTIAPVFDENCETEKWHVTCYFANENAIIMEDLRSQGYSLFGRTADDVSGLKGALTTLARLHSCSILVEDRLTQNSESTQTLNELYPGLFEEKMFESGNLSIFASTGVDLACAIAKDLNYNPDKIPKAYRQMRNLLKPSNIHRNVVCHGDLWGNNFMFREKSSSVSECVLLDFQLIRYAPLAIDLLQLLHLNTTRTFREKWEKDLVKFYHSALERTIRSNDSSSSVKVPEVTEIFAAMKDLRLVALFMTVIYIPVSLMDTEAASECTKDVTSYWNFLFRSRICQVSAHMDINETYKNRVHEAIIELAEYVDVMPEQK